MQQVKRKITEKATEQMKINRIGYNSNDILSLICENLNGDEIIFNIKDDELRKLRSFLNKIE